MNILVTDAGYKHTLGIVRSLGRGKLPPYVLSFKKNSLCGSSRYSKQEIVIEPHFSKSSFLEMLMIYKIELIILVGSESFEKIVPWKYDLKKSGVNIITVDEDIQKIAFSKKMTYELADKLGVPYPKTYYPKDLNEIDILKSQVSYPCVIKGLYEVGGNIVDYAYNSEELKSKYIEICRKHKISKETGLPMLQEYITGSGCAFFSVYNNGVCGLTFQHKRIREYPVSGGSSTCAVSYKNKAIEEYGKILLDALKWNGVSMVEFKLNNKGLPILMEINAKFWGSLDLALEAGVDFPMALIDIHYKKDVYYSAEYKYPLKYHWPLDGDILHGINNKKNLFKVLFDIFNPRVKSNIWLSDMHPTFLRVGEALKRMI
jgi:predicted ATP-grasp superfamily ATP-dependent carboligase